MIGNLILDYNPLKLGLNTILYVNNIIINGNSNPNLYNYLKLPSDNDFINNYKVLIFNLDNVIDTEDSIISIRNNFNKLVDSGHHNIIIISNISHLLNNQIKNRLISKQFNINNVKIICVQDVIVSYIKNIIDNGEDTKNPLSVGIIGSSSYYNNIIVKIYKKYTIRDIKLYLLNKNKKITGLDYILAEDINNSDLQNLIPWFNINKNIPIILSKQILSYNIFKLENTLDFSNNNIKYLTKPVPKKLKTFIKNKYNLEDSNKILYISDSLENDYDYVQELELDLVYIPSLKNIQTISTIKEDVHNSIKYILPDISFLNYYKPFKK